MTKREALELLEEDWRCPRCRYLAASRILSEKWKRVDVSVESKAMDVILRGEPRKHS